MSDYLQKIIYLTQSDYNTLASGDSVTKNGTTLTGLNDNYIYMTDGKITLNDFDNSFILPVGKGGTGLSSVASGKILVGNGSNAFTTIDKATANTANTLVQRDASGNFSAGTITTTSTKMGNVVGSANQLINVLKLYPDNASNLLLAYKQSGTGVTTSQWMVGTVDIQGVIRSSNTDLLHSRNGTNSVILDVGNYKTYAYALDGSNTGTKLQISTQSAAYTNGIQFMNSTTKKGSIGTDNNGTLGIYGTKIVLRPQLDTSTNGVEIATDAMYPTTSITLGTASNKWSTVYATTFDGNATTVSRATFGDASNAEHDANNITSNGLYYYTSNGPAHVINLFSDSNDGAIYCQAYNTNYVGQIAQDYRSGSLAVRGKNKGTWTNWLSIPTMKVEGNYPTLLSSDGTSNWIKIGTSDSNSGFGFGLLPCQSGNAGSGHGYLGTSTWYWMQAYIDEITTGNIYSTGMSSCNFGNPTLRHLTNLACYENNNASSTGTIKIKLPNTTSNNVMIVLRIIVYDYNANAGAELLVSGYMFNNKYWYTCSASVLGSYTKGIRLAHDGTNYCVLLGATNTDWNYSKIILEDVYSGYTEQPKSGYSITLITSESGYTVTGEISTLLRTDNLLSKIINIWPQNSSNYREGIRIHSSNQGWCALMLCGTDNTADQGTSTNSWGIFNYNGTLYINKNASNIETTSRAYADSNGWHFTKAYGAVWNDYAEFRKTNKEAKAGQVVIDNNDGSLSITNKRLMPGAQIVSDTFGFSIGESEEAKTPLAVSGRVLVYTYRPREEYHAGMAVCSAPNGTIDIMTREEIQQYPDAIIGIVSEIPEYEEWGTGKVKVNGRIWIKIK